MAFSGLDIPGTASMFLLHGILLDDVKKGKRSKEDVISIINEAANTSEALGKTNKNSTNKDVAVFLRERIQSFENL